MCLFFVKNLGRYRNSIISRISLDPRIGIDYIMLSSDLSAEELTHELLISVILISFKKFVGLKRGAKQNIFRKSPPIIWLAVHRTNNCWRFRKIFWHSQNIWTLTTYTIFRPISISYSEKGLLRYHLLRQVLGVNFVTFTTRKSMRCFCQFFGICYVEKGLL